MEHVLHYHDAMNLLGIPKDKREVMMCKMFTSSLKGAVLKWYDGLKPNFFDSFKDLSMKFQWQFALSIKEKKKLNHFFSIV